MLTKHAGLAWFFVLIWLFSNVGAAPRGEEWQAKVEPRVLETAAAGQTEFLVALGEQADLSGATRLATKTEKGRYVYEKLTEVAARTQKPLLADLQARGLEYRAFWAANLVWVRGDLQAVQALARRPEVARLYANPHVQLALPSTPQVQAGAAGPTAADGVEWNIDKVGAPQVWAAGFTGQGAVVAGQDTGYDWDHPALKRQYRGWNGTTANHNYNWHDAIHSSDNQVCPADSKQPCDDWGHGTHTMGTMVGDDGQGNQVGMAPGARWIGCRNMDSGFGTPARYTECYQFFLAPTDLNDQNPKPELAPDVINNSWGCPTNEGCDEPDILLQVVQNVRAAGILTVHSAGNQGSSCGSVDTPAAIYDESFTVGNTDNNDVIAPGSSRGPVTVDGSNRLKPDISAPGTSIRSSYYVAGSGGGTATYTYLSGTSMAAPHVAGLAALLISAEPSLHGQVDALENLMTSSALPLTAPVGTTCGNLPPSAVPNNAYGWGRIQAFTAYQKLQHQLEIEKTASWEHPMAGSVITYTLTVTHTAFISPTSGVVITDTLPADTTFLSATQPYTLTNDMVTWSLGSLEAGESRSVSLAVQVSQAYTGTLITNAQYGARSDQAPPVSGPPVESVLFRYSIYLPWVRNE